MTAGAALFVFSMLWPAGVADGPAAEVPIRELIYQAEVHQRVSWSLAQLSQRLENAAEPAARRDLVKAMAIIKDAMPRVLPDNPLPFTALHRPRALVRFRNEAFFLVEGLWLELGDWLGDQFVLDVDLSGLLLETRNGLQRRVDFDLAAPQDLPANFCLLFEADIDDVLFFIARREGLNTFIPQNIDGPITGRYALDDWLTLLDCICSEFGISWTRRQHSVVFEIESAKRTALRQRTKSLFRKGENLIVFLQDFVETFDMDLIVDERLSEITINIHSENQPWDEVLDCLAIANGFTWDLVGGIGDRTQLVVHKE